MKIEFKIIVVLIAALFFNSHIHGQNQPIVIDDNYNCSCSIESINGLKVYAIVDKMPEFNGGDEAKIKFLSDNIKYPRLESNEPFQSSVHLTFIIDTSGNVTNICVSRRQFSNGYSKIEKEAMRVLTIMPKWTPGVHNGKKVMVRLNMPIEFEPGQ